MFKNVLSVILGYVVMVILVVSLYSAMLVTLGASAIYSAPESWAPSDLWSVLSLVAGLVSALAGGWVCFAVAKQTRPLLWLMALVAVLGVATVGTAASAKPPAEPRPETVTPMEAAEKSVTPVPVAIGHVLVGLAGVFVVYRMKSKA
jgi:peptidoglycan/LPS O-acetylase OafA/YrhL